MIELTQRTGVSRTMAQWLVRRGLSRVDVAERFLNPRLAELTPPDGMADRDVAATRITQAVASGERIVVFGDYDCDGITSAAIMTEVLRELANAGKSGTARVTPMLASRFDGGYGVSAAAATRIIAAKPGLLITCDCGSSDHPSLQRLHDAGIDCVVIDHHLVPDEPLPVVAFLNPHRPECGFAYKGLASCGLVLSLAAALRKKLNVPLDIRKWLDLVAIGTIADVAPLDGDNRALVRAGLNALQQAKRPGVAALLQLSKVSLGAPLTARDVAFRLAPHINSPGRMGAPDLALQLLLAPNEDAALALVAEVERISTQRRELQEQMVAEAVAEIEEHGYHEQPAIVLGREGWNHGIVGIVAGRLNDRYQRPVAVIGFEGPGKNGRGSVRGPAGSRLYDALEQCQSVLVRFGGHQAAAGLELEPANLGQLRDHFVEAIRQQLASAEAAADSESGAVERSATDPDADVLEADAQDDPFQLLQDLDRLEPCGATNPRPVLSFRARVAEAREVSGGHLKLTLRLEQGRQLSGFAVNMGGRAAEIDSQRVKIVGDLRHNVYAGVDRPEVFVQDLALEPHG